MDVLVRGSCPRGRIGRSISLLSIPFLLFLLLLRHSPSYTRFFFFFFYVQQLSFPFQRFFFLLFFLSVTQLRMVAGHFWMAENETGKRGRLGCNSRDAVNAALRRKSRPFFDGNARVNVHPCSYYRFIDHFEGKFFQTLRLDLNSLDLYSFLSFFLLLLKDSIYTRNRVGLYSRWDPRFFFF